VTRPAIPRLCGANVGGWLSQSPLTPEHLQRFVSRADFAAMKAAGFNTVRVPFNAKLVWAHGQGPLEEGLRWLDTAVAWAEAEGLIVILDLHEVPGHSFKDPAENNLYQDEGRQKEACKLWAHLAARFIRHGDDVIFELLNEAVAPSTADWVRVAERLLAAIRDVDERRLVVMGSNLWNGPAQFAELPKLDDPRIIYTFHFYEPHSFTHQGAPWVKWAKDLPPQPYPGEPVGLREAMGAVDVQSLAQAGHLFRHWDKAGLAKMIEPVLAFQKEHQVPIFCGEFGVYLKAPRPDQLRWMEDFTAILKENQMGFTYWSWRGMDYGLHYEEGKWAQLPQYCNDDHRDEALLGLLSEAAKP
jgi:aryl-phospho-beta-D-glucosidase BglC (GH1 family)